MEADSKCQLNAEYQSGLDSRDWSKCSRVGHEFVQRVKRYSQTIVDEIHEPLVSKTIVPLHQALGDT